MRFEPLPPKVTAAFASSAVFEETAVRARLPAEVSPSPMVNAMPEIGVSSAVTRSVKSLSTGGELDWITVSRKLSLAVPPLVSVTVTVMREVPLIPAAGVMVTLRLEPLPPKEMLGAGTRAALVEATERLSSVAGVSGSLMVKASAGVACPCWVI